MPGYEVIELLAEGEQTRVLRATSADGSPVVIKMPRDEAAFDESRRLRHEFAILRSLSSDGVVQAYALESLRGRSVLVLEDFGGTALSQLIAGRRLELQEVLKIGLQLAGILAEVHAAGVIHKDINPSNIIFHPGSGLLKLADFGIASRVPRLQSALSATAVEGKLPYISPEQTGRMNRPLDYRTDLYSLGATLYELLTGQLLFAVDEPLEWLHCHVAMQPAAPNSIDGHIPPVVSDIALKLLAKNAEDRYQSAQGLRADLQRCLRALEGGEALRPFALAQLDSCERFIISRRLYGREAELKQLLASFERAALGEMEVVLVAGEAGIGKSALIRELYQPISSQRAYFVGGNFDSLRSSAPFSAFVFALRDLVRQLLTEDEVRLTSWRDSLNAALQPNGRLLTELIPELELIIGPQAQLAPLAPMQAERLFYRTFRHFLRAFCSQHPLVLFLDDLQWADRGSLKLIESLAQDRSNRLLLIGSYRDSEVGPGHGLQQLQTSLRAQALPLNQISLAPLKVPDLSRMVADTLRSSPQAVQPLAELVAAKTGGNPFFVGEFLHYLYERGLLSYAAERGRWHWDLKASQAEQITGNVVEFLSAKLQQIEASAQRLLELAACCGTRFRLAWLAAVSERSLAEVLPGLRQPIQMGLIFPLDDGYQRMEAEGGIAPAGEDIEFAFAHDRIRQAAYELLSKAEQREAHLAIGRLLLEQLSAQDDTGLFDAVNQYNRVHGLLSASSERLRVAELNLRAGRRAKASLAYGPALDYMNNGLALLTADSWQCEYALSLALHTEAAELAYLQHDLPGMEALLEIALKRTAKLLDRIGCYEIKIAALISRGHMNEALDLGLPLLRQLGHPLPAHPSPGRKRFAYFKLWLRLRAWSRQALLERPAVQDPYHAAAARLAARLSSAAYLGRPSFSPLLTFENVAIALKHGVSVFTPGAYAGFGMILVNGGDFAAAQDFGRLALNLADRLDARSIKPRVLHIYHSFLQPWREPLRASLEPLLQTHRLALDNGDFEYALHALNIHAYYAYFSGSHLGELAGELEKHHAIAAELKQGALIRYLEVFRQLALNLSSQCPAPWLLQGEAYQESRGHSQPEGSDDKGLIWCQHLIKTQVNYLFGRHSEALEHGTKAEPYTRHVAGSFARVSLCFYSSLAALAVARQKQGSERAKLLERAQGNHRRLRHWAKHNPHSCQHQVELLEAELHSLRGTPEAAACYDKAIASAEQVGHATEAAVACECAATHFLAADRQVIAAAYLREAIKHYGQWGAHNKVADIERRHAALLSSRSLKQSSLTGSSGKTPLADIALSSLTKALRAIAEEQAYSGMVEAIIRSTLEFAAAQRGVLLLRDHQGKFSVQAEASVDDPQSQLLQAVPLESSAAFSRPVLNYVRRTGASMVIQDAQLSNQLIPGLLQDSYLQENSVRSLLCLPIFTGVGEQRELVALLYLENNRAANTFTDDRLGVLEIICMAAAGRLELAYKAAVDGLTQLYNHAHLHNILRQEAQEAQRRERPLSLIMIDIDHFKHFNDRHGHQAGDAVLAAVAQVITRSCRAGDTAGRYGGEELAVVLPETDAASARKVAERMREAVAKLLVRHNEEMLSVTISLGVAALNAQCTDVQHLIRAADEALYQSKAAGRNRVSVARSSQSSA